ncbi:MAG: dienelactone hydrolase family protein, partial [Phycisphaeraceae bacterium]
MRTTRLALVAVMTAATCCVGDVRAEVKTESIEYDHDGVALAGYLAYDDALPGKRPGVLVVHEWYGLNDYARTRARQLAGLGYVAFALDMYGKGKVTDDT